MFLSMLKEQIKAELKIELKNQFKEEHKEICNSINQILYLEKKNDEEIITEYKHEKFEDVPFIVQKYLENRYNLKILKEYQLICVSSDYFSVYEYEYISDTIEKFSKTPKKEECLTAYEILPTKKKRTKRKK